MKNLFDGIDEAGLRAIEGCLRFRHTCFRKGDMVLSCGEKVSEIGLVRSGSVRVESVDPWGNRSVLSVIGPGGMFAEAYAVVRTQPLMVDVAANEDGEAIFIGMDRLMGVCGNACGNHMRMIRNLLELTAHRNLMLSERMFDISPKTIRGRLISYLSREVRRQGSMTVEIPFDRQQLADYLNTDRSALSKELGKMKAEGLLDYRKNRFILSEHARIEQ